MFTADDPPRSICIMRLSALGDVTHVLPVYNAIRKQWPDVEVTWICGSLEHKLLSAITDVRFIVFNKSAGWKAFWQVKQQLAGQRFDVLLHMQVAARANLLSMLIKARLRIGWDKTASRDLHQWFINQRIIAAKQMHQVEGFLAFAAALGIKNSKPVWNFPIAEQAYEFANKHIDHTRKTLLISPCSSHVMRNWMPERYAVVADYAIDKLGMQVILSGGPGEIERSTGAHIEEAMQNTALNLIGQDTLQQSMALLDKVDVVLAPDTGPVHMANATGTKVIGLYACSNSQRTGPYTSLHFCVDKYAEAAVRFLHKAVDDLPWGKKIEQPGVMDLITVEEVTAMLKRVVCA